MKRLKNIFFGIGIIVFLIIFIQNATFNGESIFGTVNFRFLLWKQNVPIIILLILSAFLGYLIAFIQIFFKHRKQNTLDRVAKEEKTELEEI